MKLEPAENMALLCRNKRCANPAHLEIKSLRANSCAGLNGVLGNHSSAFIGVSSDKRNGRWQCQIKVDGIIRHLGKFDDESDAASAYDDARFAIDGTRPNGTGAAR